jgi:hypothetical protein
MEKKKKSNDTCNLSLNVTHLFFLLFDSIIALAFVLAIGFLLVILSCALY